MSLEQSTVQPTVAQQAAASTKPSRLSRRAAARLAWLLLGVGIGLLMLMLALALVNGSLTYDLIIYLAAFDSCVPVGAVPRLITVCRPSWTGVGRNLRVR